jgi:hypothetical protein
MTYVAPGYRGIQEVRYGATGQRLIMWAEYDGAKLDPTTGNTVSIYPPNSTTALVTNAAVTEGSNNELYYDLDASNTANYLLGQNYRAVFTWNTATPTYPTPQREVVFDVVRQPLIHNIPMRVDDLYRAHVMVEEALSQTSTTSTAGDRWIVPAWQDVLRWVTSKGRRPSLVTPPEVFYGLVEARALERLFRACVNAPDDVWTRMADQAAKDFERAQNETVLRYDESDGANHVTETAWQQPQLRWGNDLRANPGLLVMPTVRSGGYRGRY